MNTIHGFEIMAIDVCLKCITSGNVIYSASHCENIVFICLLCVCTQSNVSNNQLCQIENCWKPNRCKLFNANSRFRVERKNRLLEGLIV